MVDTAEIKFPVSGGEEGTTGDDLGIEPLTAVNDLLGRVSLYHHSTDKDIVSPPDIFIGQLGYIHIDKPFLPIAREHGSYSQWAQRGI
jgi:hypothetical protein